MRCFCCGGPFHPATGDYDRVWDIARCGPCIRSFYRWMRGHTARRWGGHAFYVEAETSIRASEQSRKSDRRG